VQRLHLRITGRVQGVGFRWFAREEARRLGLSGWVVNLPDGNVEVAAGGEPSSLERLRRALEVGPTGAGVSEVTDIPGDLPPTLPYPFTIHR
jgi:acylphosphatase